MADYLPDSNPAPPTRRWSGSLYLGRVFGVPITAGLSWVGIVVLLTWSLQNTLGSGISAWFAAAFASLMFFAGVVVHELSHSVVAIRRGIPVKRIRLMIFGGVSELAHEAKRPGDEFWIAASGPLSSMAIGVLFLVGRNFLTSSLMVDTFQWIGWINIWLAATNLLPGIPLDGGRVLRSAVWKATGNRVRATRIAARSGQLLGGLTMMGGMLAFGVIGFDGLWIAFIGWILFGAASVAYARPFTDFELLETPIERVMHPVSTYVSPAVALGDVDFGDTELLPVMGPWGDVLGVLHRSSVSRKPDLRVRDAMRSIRPEEVVQVGTRVGEMLERVAVADFNVVVIAANEPIGIVRPYELTEFAGRN